MKAGMKYNLKQQAIQLCVEDAIKTECFTQTNHFVDFAAEYNNDGQFGKLLLSQLPQQIRCTQFDSTVWLATTAENIGNEPFNLGLLPPFGGNASVAIEFIKHVFEMRLFPDYIFLVHKTSARGKLTPYGYDAIFTKSLPDNMLLRDSGDPSTMKLAFTILKHVIVGEGKFSVARPYKLLNYRRDFWAHISLKGQVDLSKHHLVICCGGLNLLSFCYVIINGQVRYYVNRGEIVDCNFFMHQVNGNDFFKITFKRQINALNFAAVLTKNHGLSDTKRHVSQKLIMEIFDEIKNKYSF